ncbi:hypothetical protein Pla163_17980 [Planctomycetes bacterium Pla163]|uniref:PDZ domain-containing protein n=1 Tax=Rohdeia mirabilis TaxID=2528008 RepID=A0A518CZM8_9BACT|nr:hypothetical protein Pla163_17980 [Planctomycetes bacterium Pla163]
MNARSVLLLVVGLLVGLGLGLALAPQNDAPPLSVAIDAPPAATPTATGSVTDLADDSNETRRATEAASTTLARNVPSIPAGAIAAAVERAPAPAIFEAAGSGVITGSVVDVEGEPLAGVRVVGTPFGTSSSIRESLLEQPPAMVLRSLEDVLQAQAELWASLHGLSAVTTTGVDGRFVLEGLPESGSIRVRAYLEGFVVRNPSGATANGAELALVARRGVPVTFRVLDARGELVEKAQLFVRHQNDKEMVEWTPRAQPLLLFEGRNHVRAALGAQEDALWRLDRIEDFTEAVGEEIAIDVRSSIGPIELTVPDSQALVVRLTSGAVLPPDFVGWVVLTERGAERRGRERSLIVRGPVEEVSFGGLESGVYDVGLRLDGFSEMAVSVEVDYSGSRVVIDLEVPPLERSEPLRVRVASPSGEWLEDVGFQLTVKSGGVSRSSGMRSTWVGDGWYEVRMSYTYVPSIDEAAESLDEVEILSAAHEAHGTVEAVIEEGRTVYQLVFDPVGSLDVTVSGWNSGKDEGRVTLRPAGQEEMGDLTGLGYSTGPLVSGRSEAVGSRGSCSFAAVPIGQYEVLVVMGGQVVARADVTIAAGANALRLVPEPRYDVLVDCPNLPPGTQIRLEPVEREAGVWSNLSAETGEDHVAVIEGVVAGSYHLQAGLHMETIDVPCGRILVEAALPNAVRIKVYEDDGAFAQLGFEHEDLVIGADGALFADIQELGRAFNQLGSQAVTLLVERGGERIELVTSIVEGGRMALQDPGGSFGYETRD